MKSCTPSKAAFTIVELLVAAAITVLIVVMLGTMFGALITTTGRASHRIDAFRDARAALQLIRNDFETLVKAQPAGYFSLDPDDGIGPDVRQLCGLISAKNQPAGGAVAGDLCAVRYYSAWDETGRVYTLHRFFKDSDQTLQAIQAKLMGGVLSYVPTQELYYDGPGTDEAVATCAWNLQVVAYDSSGNIIKSKNDVFGQPTTDVYTCDESQTIINPLPASIEISFKALGIDAARTVVAATAGRTDAFEVWKVVDNASPASGDQTLYDNLIKPHVYDFRTRIRLK